MTEASHSFEEEQGRSGQPARKAAPNMRLHSPYREDPHFDRTDPRYAFVWNEGMSQEQIDHDQRVNQQLRDSLINANEYFLHELGDDFDDHIAYMRGQMSYIVAGPHRHQAGNIERHAKYLQELGMPSEQAVFASTAPEDDISDDILRSHGFTNVWRQQDVFDSYFNDDDRRQLWDILQLPKDKRDGKYVSNLRKQGTMMAMVLGTIDRKPHPDTPFFFIDTDIQNIGIESRGNLEQMLGTSQSENSNLPDKPMFQEGEKAAVMPNYDPVTYLLAALDGSPSAASVQVAKKDRNNFPVQLVASAASELGKWGEVYAEGASDLWLLTGEFGERYRHLLQQIWGTQYSVETMKRLWQIHTANEDPDFERKQIAINRHIPRRDGSNTTGKEFPMYADAAKLLTRTLLHAEQKNRGFHEFTLDDIREINAHRMQKQGIITFTDYDSDDYPGIEPKQNMPVLPSVLFPSIQQLSEAGIGRFPEHVKKYFRQ